MPNKTQAPKLTGSDYSEIYYALGTKVKLIEDGYYGPEDAEGQDSEWAEHLKEIMAKIQKAVDV